MQTTVLIIEDNRDNYYLMQYLLENKGYKVLGADSGWLGLEMAIYNTPSIILLDIQLMSNPFLSGIPIVVVSSYAMTGNKEQALSAGATGYIEKPIDPLRFADQIESYLKA